MGKGARWTEQQYRDYLVNFAARENRAILEEKRAKNTEDEDCEGVEYLRKLNRQKKKRDREIKEIRKIKNHVEQDDSELYVSCLHRVKKIKKGVL